MGGVRIPTHPSCRVTSKAALEGPKKLRRSHLLLDVIGGHPPHSGSEDTTPRLEALAELSRELDCLRLSLAPCALLTAARLVRGGEAVSPDVRNSPESDGSP